MPKMVTELAQGNTFGRSAEAGNLADQAQRVYKIILNSPDESVDIFSAIGVNIGDPYSGNNPIPCVSIEGRSDGESRLVRIVTASYRTTVGGDEGGQDPGTFSPDVRPANFSTSTTLYEAPAYEWREYPAVGMLAGAWTAIVNVNGEPIDGISRMESITTIRVTQFSAVPGTIHAQHAGKINEETMNLGSYLSCAPHTVLFRGVEAQPHVETFGDTVYRGFMNSYEFAYRPNKTEQHGECGWDVTPLHTGFMVKAFAVPGRQDQDEFGQPLKIDNETKKIAVPLALEDGVQPGTKQRAMVRAGWYQNPSAQPIALNEDGTPRDTEKADVIVWRRQVQQEINLTQTLQLRLT